MFRYLQRIIDLDTQIPVMCSCT